MKKHFATAGHNIRKDGRGTGASYRQNGKVIYDEAVMAREFITAYAKILHAKHGIMTYTESDTLTHAQTVNYLLNESRPGDLCIEWHFNASSNNLATGTEFFIPEKYTEQELTVGKDLAKIFSDVLNIPLRSGKLMRELGVVGVKTESESQHPSLGIISRPHWGVNLLAEKCFITNLQEIERFVRLRHVLAEQTADYIAAYLKK